MKIGRRNNVKINILMFKVSELWQHNRRARAVLARRDFEMTLLKCALDVSLGSSIKSRCFVFCCDEIFEGGFRFRDKRITSHLVALIFVLHLVTRSKIVD